MRKGGGEAPEKSGVTQSWVGWHVTRFVVKVSEDTETGRHRGSNEEVELQTALHMESTLLCPGELALICALYTSRTDTNSSAQSSSQAARHRRSYESSTHSP